MVIPRPLDKKEKKVAACRIGRAAMGAAVVAAWLGRTALAHGDGTRRLARATAFQARS